MEMTFETPGTPTYPSTGVGQKRHLGQFSLPTGVSHPCIHLRARCLKVTGLIELRDAGGKVLLTKNKVWLCRCGASTKKPFCDGTHSKIGFQAAAKAVPGSAEGD
jgi:CDGSH-type Zn-finger protein